jgi:hypothetical protein
MAKTITKRGAAMMNNAIPYLLTYLTGVCGRADDGRHKLNDNRQWLKVAGTWDVTGPGQGALKRVDIKPAVSAGEPCQSLSALPSVSAQGRAGPGETMVITGGCEAPALASDSKLFGLRFVWGSR